MTIVYTSNTGFTQQYAEMLGKAEHMNVLTLEQAAGGLKTGKHLKNGEEIIYMGPLMASHIGGLDRAVKRYKVVAAVGVGMSPPTDRAEAELRRANFFPEGTKVFYLHGGWNPKRAGWLRRRMVNAATRDLRQRLAEKKNPTQGDLSVLEMLTNGGSFVAYENLADIQRWLKERR